MTKLFIFLCCTLVSVVQAQEKLSVFGLQFKPIVPASYFDGASISDSQNDYQLNLSPRYSYSTGMVIRYGLSKTFSFESGLNLIQRNYRLGIDNTNIGLSDYTDFGLRSYELPIQLLAYVRTSEHWYINAAFGVSQNTFASDIFSAGEESDDFYQNTGRRLRGQRALLANLGVEYRSAKDGFFYLGASLHRPWKEIARVYPEYDDGINKFNPLGPNAFYLDVLGNFVTLDFRYFFGK